MNYKREFKNKSDGSGSKRYSHFCFSSLNLTLISNRAPLGLFLYTSERVHEKLRPYITNSWACKSYRTLNHEEWVTINQGKMFDWVTSLESLKWAVVAQFAHFFSLLHYNSVSLTGKFVGRIVVLILHCKQACFCRKYYRYIRPNGWSDHFVDVKNYFYLNSNKSRLTLLKINKIYIMVKKMYILLRKYLPRSQRQNAGTVSGYIRRK